MTHRWSISLAAGSIEHTGGTAGHPSDALLEALAAARTALADGSLEDVAVIVDGSIETLLYPARDASGAVDVEDLTASLVEIYQAATAGDVAARIVRGPTQRP